MRVYLKTINGELNGAYYVYKSDYESMRKDDDWKIKVFMVKEGEVLAFTMERDVRRIIPTQTSSSTVAYHQYIGTGSTFTYTHTRYTGVMKGEAMEFKSLWEMIDVMCTKHRILK